MSNRHIHISWDLGRGDSYTVLGTYRREGDRITMINDFKRVAAFGIGDKLMSERRLPLVLSAKYEWITPVLTVELYTKWYELFLVKKEWGDLVLYSVHFGHLEDVCPADVSPFLDHCPNPLCVRLFAARNDFHLDELADELITGRWQNEYIDSSVMQCRMCEGTGQIDDSTCMACKGHGATRLTRDHPAHDGETVK
jgi:hypothetical protein